MTVDEPPELGGGDAGMNSVELIPSYIGNMSGGYVCCLCIVYGD